MNTITEAAKNSARVTKSENSRAEINTPLIIDGLQKSFASIPVLRGISMTVERGEIHALMGGNGAGKSTLIKCLSGYWKPDAGTITVAGAPFDARKRQISFVQQDLGLVPSLTVLENISLGAGFATGRLSRILWRHEAEKAAKILSDLGHEDISPYAEIRELNPVQKTTVAIARATLGLSGGANLLVLDEPTASLPHSEIGRLFETLEKLRSTGVGMIYVSHHLSEVFKLADRISVLREGNLVMTERTAGTSDNSVIEAMLGRGLNTIARKVSGDLPKIKEPILKLTDISADKVKGVTFEVARGEIIGLVGLEGAGCSELAEVIFGARPVTSGTFVLDSCEVSFKHPNEAVTAGIGMITKDRHVDGSFGDHTVGENIAISDLRRFFQNGRLRRKPEIKEVGELVRKFDIRPADGERRFSSLSGGNQQKAILAKWMRLNPKVLICDQPDIGVDIGAKNTIYAAIQAICAAGSAVIIISNQYDDLEMLCDRVIVMRSGEIVSELTGASVTERDISLAAVGSGIEISGQLQ